MDMTVGELIEELNKYDKNQRVLLCSTTKQDDILGCYEEEFYDENDNVIEKVISLYQF
jgi:hypothetical protein